MTPRHGPSDILDFLLELPLVEKKPAATARIPTGESTIDTWNEAHGAEWVANSLCDSGRWVPVWGEYPTRSGEWHCDFVGSSTPGNSTSVYPDGHLSNFSETAASNLRWLGVRQKHDAVDVAIHLHHGGDAEAWRTEARAAGFGKAPEAFDMADWDAHLVTIYGEPPGGGELPDGDWYFSDVHAVLDGDYSPPIPNVLLRDDGSGVFYEGRINMVFGESGAFKSYLTLQAAKETMEINGRSVLYLDWEDDVGGSVLRLLTLGVDPEVIRRHFIHVKPQAKWNPLAEASIVHAIENRDVSLVIIDSTGEAMALDGAKPNDDDDTARWFQALPQRLVRLGATAILVDHVPKANEGGGPRLQSIGSQRKRAAVTGLSLSVEVVKSPAKGENGLIKGICAKDRWGAYPQKSTVAMIEVLSLDDGGRVEINVKTPRPEDPVAHEEAKLRGRAEDVYLLLRDDGPAGKEAIVKGVTGRATDTRKAVEALLERGIVEISQADGTIRVVREFEWKGPEPDLGWLNGGHEDA